MMSELRMEMAEQHELEIKAKACDKLLILLNNAICYMEENGEDLISMAKYLGTSVDIIRAIDMEDIDSLVEGD